MLFKRKRPLISFGRYIDSVARVDAKLAALIKDPKGQLNQFYDTDLTGPGVPEIVVHVNTAQVMHMVIPWAPDVDEAKNNTEYKYPDPYDPGHPDHIPPQTEREEAVLFRVGDYTLQTCM